MPNCLSVEKKLFPMRLVRSENGSLVPWEVRGYFEDFESSHRPFGFFDLSHWEMVAVSGKDAADFLHRMSTANLKKLGVGQLDYLAFLTGRANAVAFGYVWRLAAEEFRLWFPAGQGVIANNHIEKFHFAESFQLSAVVDLALTAVWIPSAPGQAQQLRDAWFDTTCLPRVAVSLEVSGIPVVYFRDDVRPELFWVTLKPAQLQSFWEACSVEGGHLLGQRLFEHFRIRAGVPEVGKEISEKEIFLEGNFEPGVARNKGCYPGQEVIERIFTYGQVNKKLLPVCLSSSVPFPLPPFVLQCADKSVGSVVAVSEIPESPHTAIGLAYVGKAFWETKEVLTGPAGLVAELKA